MSKKLSRFGHTPDRQRVAHGLAQGITGPELGSSHLPKRFAIPPEDVKKLDRVWQARVNAASAGPSLLRIIK